MEIQWSEFKRIIDDRQLSVQWVIVNGNYWLKAVDGFFSVDCMLPLGTDPDTVEFEEHYKPHGNKSPTAQVVTSREKNDKDMKLARARSVCAPGAVGHVFMKVPGELRLDPETGMPIEDPVNDRWINGGQLIVVGAQPGDWVELDVTANEELEQLMVLKTFTEDAGTRESNGWYVDPAQGFLKVTAQAPAHGYAGMFLHLTYHAVADGTERKLFLNASWDQKSPEL